MTNSRRHSINYVPRMTQLEAYDASPSLIRAAHKEGPQEWDTYHFLLSYRKMVRKGVDASVAERRVARSIISAHSHEIRKGQKMWTPRLPGQRWADLQDSPHNRANATMQLSDKSTFAR